MSGAAAWQARELHATMTTLRCCVAKGLAVDTRPGRGYTVCGHMALITWACPPIRRLAQIEDGWGWWAPAAL